jgi:multicomponent Na+:H+ antiporter subunit D
LLVSLTIGFSVFAGPVYGLAAGAAQQLLNRDGYVRAVLGEGGRRAAR